MEFTIDCSFSKNMHFSEEKAVASKVIRPGEMELMMIGEAIAGAEQYVKSCEVSFKHLL